MALIRPIPVTKGELSLISTTFPNEGTASATTTIPTEIGDIVVITQYANSTKFPSYTGADLLYSKEFDGGNGQLVLKATSTSVQITQSNSAATWGSYQYLAVIRAE